LTPIVSPILENFRHCHQLVFRHRHAVAGFHMFASVHTVPGVHAVAGVSAVVHFIGLFYYVNDRITDKYLVRHRHRCRHSIPLVPHRHSASASVRYRQSQNTPSLPSYASCTICPLMNASCGH